MIFFAHSGKSQNKSDWQELRRHLDSVGVLTSRLSGKIGLPLAGELIGLAHDLGKYSDEFQLYLQKVAGEAMEIEPDSQSKGSVDHSTAGAQIIEATLAS